MRSDGLDGGLSFAAIACATDFFFAAILISKRPSRVGNDSLAVDCEDIVKFVLLVRGSEGGAFDMGRKVKGDV